MPIFVATISPRSTTHDYSPLWAALGRANAQSLGDSSWLLDVAQDIRQVTPALVSLCAEGDCIFIVELTSAAWAGSHLSDEARAWLRQRLPTFAAPPAAMRPATRRTRDRAGRSGEAAAKPRQRQLC